MKGQRWKFWLWQFVSAIGLIGGSVLAPQVVHDPETLAVAFAVAVVVWYTTTVILHRRWVG